MEARLADSVFERVGRLDVERRLRNARLMGWGIALCVLPTVVSNLMVDEASILLRLVPVLTAGTLIGSALAATRGHLRWAIVGIIGGGAVAMLTGVVTHPQLWVSPYGLGLLVLAASTIANPRGVVVTMLVAMLVLAAMGAMAWEVPQQGAPVPFTLVSAGVLLVIAAVVTLLQLRTTRSMTEELLAGERRQLEAERHADALQLQLTQAQKMEAIGQLAGGVAHDFNNYLQIIAGSADLARSTLPAGHESQVYLDDLVESVGRARELTKQILTFSKRQVMPAGQTDVGEALESLIKLIKMLVGAAVSVELEVTPGQHIVPLGAGQLEQVLMNLVVNARDAMERKGKLKVVVSVQKMNDEECVELSVSDTGPGMPEEVQRRAFEPFFTTKPEGKGTGLGLPTCLNIIEQAGGELAIESVLGVGTTFRIRLPRI